MSEVLMMTCAVIDEDNTPDWDAAERRITAITESELTDRTDLAERFTADNGEDDPRSASEVDIEALKRRLREDLREFREGLEGERTDLDYLLVRGARIWVTGGPSFGDEPTEMTNPMNRLELAGVLAAAGFDGD